MRSLNELAAEMLASTNVSWDAVRQICRLLLAYADYNCAAADSKRGPAIAAEPGRVVEAVVTAFGELDDLHESCEQAWRDYLQSEWPRGAFDVWRQNDERFCTALERNTAALELLALKHFRNRTAGA